MLPGVFRALICWLLLAPVACEAELLRAEVRPIALRPRGQAPEMVEVKLVSSAAGLLEGPLEFTLTDGGTTLCRYRTHTLTLSPGEQSFRFMLPLGTSREASMGCEAGLRFLDKRAAIELGKFSIESRLNAERVLTIAVSKPRLVGPQRELSLWQSLRLERFQPGERSSSAFATAPVFLETEDFPASPLAFCAYDMVLLDGEGFTLLREKHLAALIRWVLGGGSLCVRPGEAMKPEHRQFLEELLASDSRALTVEFDATGRPLLPGDDGLLLARPGLGRLVLTTLSLDAERDFEQPAWKKAVTFLWRFRAAQAEQVLRSGEWKMFWPKTNDPARDGEKNALSNLLMPRTVRLVPLAWILAILAGFIIVIGPVDWFVLGRLKMRRYTWVFFPCVSAGFTIFTVWLAGQYMGKHSQRSALIITDLGHDGRVLRETRFELIFPASNQEAMTEVHNALCAPVSTIATSLSRGDRSTPDIYEGQFPAHYTLRQQLRQWSPQVNRLTSFEPGGEAAKIPWERVPAWLAQRGDISPESDDAVFVLRGGAAQLLVRPRDGSVPVSQDLVRQLCAGSSTPTGLFTVVEQISPNGAGKFDDLMHPAATDPSRLLIVVARREKSGAHLFRRSFDR